jgi:O-antigen/teichoic acid export membrane protein
MYKIAFYSFAVRSISLVVRLAFIIFFGKFYSLELIGIYGLIVGLSAICSQLIPFEFHNYSTLEILKPKILAHQKKLFLIQHVFFTTCMILLSVPILYISYDYTTLPYSLFLPITFLVIFETYSKDFGRILIALEKPIQSYTILFLLTVPWTMVILFLINYNVILNIEGILQFWILSSFLAFIYGFYCLDISIKNLFNIKRISFDWIKKGISFSYPFLVAVIGYSLSQYIGRFILSDASSNEIVGIFSLFFQIAAITFIITDLSISIYLPSYIRNRQNKDLSKNYNYEKIVFSFICLFIIILNVIDHYLLKYINSELLNYINVFELMLIGIGLIAFSTILKLRLYVKKMNHEIMIIYLVSMIFSIFFNFYLINNFQILGSAYALILTGGLLCVLMIYYDLKSRNFLNIK